LPGHFSIVAWGFFNRCLVDFSIVAWWIFQSLPGHFSFIAWDISFIAWGFFIACLCISRRHFIHCLANHDLPWENITQKGNYRAFCQDSKYTKIISIAAFLM
jgi:hypothetical protein